MELSARQLSAASLNAQTTQLGALRASRSWRFRCRTSQSRSQHPASSMKTQSRRLFSSNLAVASGLRPLGTARLAVMNGHMEMRCVGPIELGDGTAAAEARLRRPCSGGAGSASRIVAASPVTIQRGGSAVTGSGQRQLGRNTTSVFNRPSLARE